MDEYASVQSPALWQSLRGAEASAGSREKLSVSQSVEPEDLRCLLASLAQEDCVHSWKNFNPEGTVEELRAWENQLRPTQLFFFHLSRGDTRQMVAAGAVADTLTRDFPDPGFCVVGRCYIMPAFRNRGLYRQVLQFRLEYCRARFGTALNAVHMGSDSERIEHVANYPLPGWPRFIHLGEEELRLADRSRSVAAYLLFMPEYLQRLRASLAGARAPAAVVEVRSVMAQIDSGAIRNFGGIVKNTLNDAHAREWLKERHADEIEQLLSFCSAIPLVGFDAGSRGR